MIGMTISPKAESSPDREWDLKTLKHLAAESLATYTVSKAKEEGVLHKDCEEEIYDILMNFADEVTEIAYRRIHEISGTLEPDPADIEVVATGILN